MDLLDKIQKIQALIDKTSSEGERQAAELARQRLHERLREDSSQRPIEYKVASHSRWEKKLFTAVCKKNGLIPYRYSRQKYTTTMVRVSKSTMDNILWPQYQKYAGILRDMVDTIALDLIDKIYAGDKEETIISGEIPCAN
jgi:hypothetical protein